MLINTDAAPHKVTNMILRLIMMAISPLRQIPIMVATPVKILRILIVLTLITAMRMVATVTIPALTFVVREEEML